MPPLDTAITAVTVYTHHARVTRRGAISLDPGQHTLVVEGLPLALDPDSVRVGGQGTGVRLLSVDVRRVHHAEVPREDIAALEDQIEDLQEQDRQLIDEGAALEEGLKWLGHLAEQSGESMARSLSRNQATLDDLTALNGYLQSARLDHHARQRELGRQRVELARQIDALKRQLNDLRSAYTLTSYAVEVIAETPSAVELTLEVDYLIGGAGWQPVYDLRLDDEGVTLTYLSRVTQSTGEDWPEVDLTLSTARPAASTTLPELRPWYVDFRYYHPVAAAMPRMKGLAFGGAPAAADQYLAEQELQMMAPAEAPAAPPPPQPVTAAVAGIETGSGGAVTYRVARPVTIPSDGQPYQTAITLLNLGVELDYLCAPRLAEEAYLRATVTNTSDVILLPGEAAIFHGTDFVGKTYLETVVPTEEFEVHMGVDDRIRVERELVRRDVGKGGIGNRRRSEFAYEITLTNLVGRASRIEVQDQLPVSRNEAIKVKLLDSHPAPDEHSDLNVLTWNLIIEPGQKAAITYGFSVEHPRDRELDGLDI